jgi:hypothetical protein
MKNQIEKDVEAAIRLLRFMTYNEGTVALSAFDSGSFEEGSVWASLERSGLIIENKKFYSPHNFKVFLMNMVNPFHFSEEELLDRYKKHKWDDE